MTNYIGWTPPPGVAVVPPPVHVETKVDLFFSDASHSVESVRAGSENWSAEGDGPHIVAYAVVGEYKPAPEPWEGYVFWDGTIRFAQAQEPTAHWKHVIHVREVPPAAREVGAWAVVRGDDELTFGNQGLAEEWAAEYGGTVVRLSGVMPNE